MKSFREVPNQKLREANQKFRRVGQYQLLEMLGKGANGIVFKGLNVNDGSLVAIKEMLIGKSEMKSIKSQLTFLKQLDHTSIVKYLDAVQKQNRIYLILEYVEGGSLAVLAKKSHLTEDIVKLYIKQVLQGLVFLHREGVIHRDIKGANILIDKYGKVKLADFGVAVKLQESQKTISAAGSPYWMAPQIITSQSDPTTKCDIWSLGCTIIQLLTGNPPYHQLLQFPAIFRIVEDKHPPLPQSSPLCRDFMISCFQKNPAKRSSAADLMNHPWLKGSFASLNVLMKVSQNEQIVRQIQKNLVPWPNFQQLQNIYNKIQSGKVVILHKSFMNIFQQNMFEQRACFLCKILRDPDSFVYLSKIGVFHQQFEFMEQLIRKRHQNQISLSNVKYLGYIGDILTELMVIKMYNYSRDEMSDKKHLLLDLILNQCVRAICLLIKAYSKSQVRFQQVLTLLNRFIELLELKEDSLEENQKDIFIVISKLIEFDVLQPILHNYQQLQQKSCLHLEIILKIIPSLSIKVQQKGIYLKLLQMIGEIILKQGFFQPNHSLEEYSTIKLLCLGQLAETQTGKTILQKNGIILHISSYLKFTQQKPSYLNMLHFYETICILGKLLKKGKKYNFNRVIQFHRYGCIKIFQFWFRNFEEEFKKCENLKNGSDDLLNKMLDIKKVFKFFQTQQ